MDLIITEKPNVSKQVKEVLAPYAKARCLWDIMKMKTMSFATQSDIVSKSLLQRRLTPLLDGIWMFFLIIFLKLFH